MGLGAVGGLAAVATGLVVAKGQIRGNGSLLWHHRFVWPAFAMMIAAAVWRLAMGERVTRRQHVVYFALVLVLAILVSAAGYWGGEMLLGAA